MKMEPTTVTMNKVCFVVMIGLPGAGKTTFCESFKEKCSIIKVIHVCFDKFLRIGDNLDLETGQMKEKRRHFLEILGRLAEGIKLRNKIIFEEANEDLAKHFNENIQIDLDLQPTGKIFGIFLDDNMYYRSMRYGIVALARKYGAGFLQVHLDVSLEQAQTRNATRSNPIPQEIVSRMWIKLEKPNEQFYKWERNTVNLTVNYKLEEIMEIKEKIAQCANNPEHPIEQDVEREPVEQSTLHKVDLLLRKAVSDIIKDRRPTLNGLDLKQLSEHLMSRRRTILNDFKMGLIEVDPRSTTNEQIQSLF
ncbi:hypothetical protein RP20_CCG013389 [Aedes albopictus]|nr:hypothetical protein RP20_CCG013389 [Aedes albopictus]